MHPDREEEEENGRDSVVFTSLVLDKAFARLISFVYGEYPESHPFSSPPLHPRCGFENLFAVADPQGSFRPKLHLYPRVSEIISQTQDRSARLAHENEPLHQVLPLKHHMFTVTDDPDFTKPLLVNSDFSRLTGNKTIAKTRMGLVSFADLEKLEKCSRSLLEGNSHALWLMSVLLSQLKCNGFLPSDPTLFDKAISSISCTLASQILVAVAMSDFPVSRRRESHLAHVTLPISASQKRNLVSPGSDSSLSDQSLLEKVSGQVKEDFFILSSLSLAKSGGKIKSSSSSSSSVAVGSSRYSSPLYYPVHSLVHQASVSVPLPLPVVAVVSRVVVAGACPISGCL